MHDEKPRSIRPPGHFGTSALAALLLWCGQAHAGEEQEAAPPAPAAVPAIQEEVGAGDTGAVEVVPAEVVELEVRQVQPLRVVTPDFPAAARALGVQSVRCTAEVTIDPRGVPRKVVVEGCPAELRPAVQEAMLRWRFAPAKVEGEAVEARFRQDFRFELR